MWTGPKPAAYSSIQPWPLLKTQARRLPAAAASSVLSSSQVTAQNANWAGAKGLSNLRPRLSHPTRSPGCADGVPLGCSAPPTQLSCPNWGGLPLISRCRCSQAHSLENALPHWLPGSHRGPDGTVLLYFHGTPSLLCSLQWLPIPTYSKPSAVLPTFSVPLTGKHMVMVGNSASPGAGCSASVSPFVQREEAGP